MSNLESYQDRSRSFLSLVQKSLISRASEHLTNDMAAENGFKNKHFYTSTFVSGYAADAILAALRLPLGMQVSDAASQFMNALNGGESWPYWCLSGSGSYKPTYEILAKNELFFWQYQTAALAAFQYLPVNPLFDTDVPDYSSSKLTSILGDARRISNFIPLRLSNFEACDEFAAATGLRGRHPKRYPKWASDVFGNRSQRLERRHVTSNRE
jgi:hypothetical protein